MLVSHRNYLTVFGRDLVKVSNPLEERGTLRRGRRGPVIGEREHRDGLARRGEHVDPLVAVLKRQVDHRVASDTSPPGEVEPDHPIRVAGTRRAFRAVRDAVGASAAVTPVVRQDVTGVIRGVLLGPRPAVFLVGFRLLPPAELREVQGVIFLHEPPLDLGGPLLETLGEIGGVHRNLPVRWPGRAISLRAHEHLP